MSKKSILSIVLLLSAATANAADSFTTCYGAFWTAKSTSNARGIIGTLGKTNNISATTHIVNQAEGTSDGIKTNNFDVKFEGGFPWDSSQFKSEFKGYVKDTVAQLKKNTPAADQGQISFRLNGCSQSPAIKLETEDYDYTKY